MIPIRYAGRIAALAEDRVHFAPHIEALEPDHPVRRFVGAMTLVARAIEQGERPGPYRDETTEQTVRAGFLPDDLFKVFRERPDWWLAEFFEVPLEQVIARRIEMAPEAAHKHHRQ